MQECPRCKKPIEVISIFDSGSVCKECLFGDIKTMQKTKLEEKIEELKTNIRLGGELDANFLALAHYIKEEVMPEEKRRDDDWSRDQTIGFNACRSEVVDKFKELGIE